MRTLVSSFVLVTVAAGMVVGYGALFAVEKIAEKLFQKTRAS